MWRGMINDHASSPRDTVGLYLKPWWSPLVIISSFINNNIYLFKFTKVFTLQLLEAILLLNFFNWLIFDLRDGFRPLGAPQQYNYNLQKDLDKTGAYLWSAKLQRFNWSNFQSLWFKAISDLRISVKICPGFAEKGLGIYWDFFRSADVF